MLFMELHEASDVRGDVRVHIIVVQLLVAGLELLNLFFGRFQVTLQLLEILLILLLQLPVGLLLGLDFWIRYRGGTCLLAVCIGIQHGTAVLADILLLLEVVIVVTDVVIEAVFEKLEDTGRGLVDEVTVMGHVEHGALVVPDRVLEHFTALDIQVVRRLVEDEEVRVTEHQLREGHTALLATGEVADALIHIIATEEEGREHVAHLRVVQVRVVVLDLIEDGLLHVEHGMFLIVVADLDVRAELKAAGRRRLLLVQDLEQRGLAGTIRTDHRNVLTALDFEGNVREERLLAEGLTELLHGQHIISGLEMRGQCQSHLIIQLLRLIQKLHLCERLLTGLCTLDGLLPVKLLQLIDDRLLVRDVCLLIIVGLQLRIPDLFLLLGVLGVVAAVHAGSSVIEVDDLRHDMIEEIPVMGDEQNRSVVALQHLLKPLNRLDVEVVRRLIEDEEVRLREEDLLEALPGLLPSGQGIEIVPVGLDLLLHREGLRICEIRRDIVFRARHVGMLLREVTDLLPLRKRDYRLGIIRLLLAQDTLNKRRLAGSIDADNRRFFLVLDMKGDAL